MRGALLVVLLLASGCVSHWPAGPTPLAAAMREELQRDAPLAPSPALARAKGLHFLFIAGFLSETIPGYFVDNTQVVKDELGAEASSLFPPSAGSLEDDAVLVRDTVNQVYEKEHRPVVLVGHSKGAVAAVLAVLRFPELVSSGRVDRVVAIQGPFRGSPVASGVTSTVPLPLVYRRFKGLSALEPRQTCDCFDGALAQPRPAALSDWLRGHVFYVRAWEAAGDVSPELQVTHGYLSRRGSGLSDGLVLEEDMKLDAVGRDLGVLKGDHAAFTVSGALSNSTAAERRAFTRALLREIFEPPPG